MPLAVTRAVFNGLLLGLIDKLDVRLISIAEGRAVRHFEP
jgi:hypothetical protein